jgi:gentisate 1,2-dioxygenase
MNPSSSEFANIRQLDELDPILDAIAMRAGWKKKEPSLWAEPRPSFLPMHWHWAHAHQGLSTSGPLISTELAERRNLFLVNPIPNNHYATLRTLVCAYQMIRPGERARSHRHSPNALRLVLSASQDVYTVVDGERLDMHPNDVVLTPGNMWHGHANDGSEDAYWIDFLDVPMVHLLEPMFLEHWPAGYQEPNRSNSSSHLSFPWSEVSRQLNQALTSNPVQQSVSIAMDAPSIPTLDLSMTLIRSRGCIPSFKATDNRIVAVVQGRGRTQVGQQSFDWERGDVMALPGWIPVEHVATDEAVLFTVSDSRMQRALGYFRSDRSSP